MPVPSSRPHRRIAARTIRAANVCALCGGLLDKTLPAPHPMSVVADHIMPRARRPDLALDPANFQAAHRSCNRAKSDRLDYTAVPAPSQDW